MEVWVWRIIPKQEGRGEHRKLIDNLIPAGWEHFWTQRDPGTGRYRVEFRDARRAIVRVLYFIKLPRREGGRVIATKGRRRPPKRKVPPPVAGWDPDAPRATAPEASDGAPTPVQSPQKPRPRPSLTPPGKAPEGTCWRLRKSGKWDLINPTVPLTAAYVCLLLQIGEHHEYIFVYAPKRRWPDYELVTLGDGSPCLVPKIK